MLPPKHGTQNIQPVRRTPETMLREDQQQNVDTTAGKQCINLLMRKPNLTLLMKSNLTLEHRNLYNSNVPIIHHHELVGFCKRTLK